MGMSTHVIGLITESDPTYLKHKKVLLACAEAGIKELPKETADYFGYSYPEECALEEKLTVKIPKHNWRDDMREGYEIIVSEIPVGVERIRFYISF